MNVFALSSMVTAIATILLGSFVLIKNVKSKKNRAWFYTSCAIFLWTFGLFWCFQEQTSLSALFWQKVLYLGTTLIPITYCYYCCLLVGKERENKIWLRIGAVLATIFIFFLFFTDFLISGIVPRNDIGYWAITFTPLYYFYLIYFVFYVFFFFHILRRGIRENEGIRKNQIKFVYYAGLVGFIGGSFNFLLDFGINYPIGNLFVFLYVAFIAYAITRYRLMDIRSFIRKSSVFTLLILIMSSLFVLLSTLIANVLDVFIGGNSYLWSGLVVAVIFSAVFQPLKKLLEWLTDKFLFTKDYNASEVLINVNKILSSTIDLDKLLIAVSENLESVFHYSKIGFAFIDKADKKAQLKVYYQDGFDEKVLQQFSQDKIKVLPWYFSESKEIKVIDELKAQYEAGEYQPKSVELLNGLYELNISLVIPLFAKDGLIGLIILGNKKSGDPYSGEDLRVINIISGQLGMAIENARLYEQQKNFNLHLKDEVKKATGKLEAANKELQRLDDAKSEFLSIASHQLRTPLTITKGYVSMMNEGSFGKVPKIIKENLGKIYIANERLLNLVENLLDISRIEAGRLEFNLEPVDLVETAKALVSDFQERAKAKKLKLEFFPDPKLPKCQADAQKIKEVISNLIDNSVKYTNKGEIIIGIHQESQSLIFSCQDTGMGIEPEDLPRLFNKFVRGKGMMTVHTEGTGLGLYFARVVIENMGGRIWAESPGKNRGSKFAFSLPLADKKKAQKIKTEEK
ncbi:MAG: ATP-binding protein [Patescibacteria group bacterium]|jgi:signal transduction histidine kinase